VRFCVLLLDVRVTFSEERNCTLNYTLKLPEIKYMPTISIRDRSLHCDGSILMKCISAGLFNRSTPNDPYMGCTATLTSKRCILCIYSTNIGTDYFKHALYSPFFSLQNAVCFIMLTCLVPVLFTFCIQVC